MIKDSQRIAIMAGSRNVTFSELLQRTTLYARQSHAGKGDRTLIFAENREGWIFAFYSVWATRGIAVPVDASSTVSDVAYILKDCTPVAVWTTRTRLATVQAAMEETGLHSEVHLIEDFESVPCNEPKASVAYDEEDTALIIYTSGTTGSPKGVMLSFRNILVNINAVYHEVPIFNENTRTLVLLPLHHVLPLVGTVVMPMYCGCGVAICPTMSGPDIMATLQRGKIAIMVGVPRLWQTLYVGIMKKVNASFVARNLFKLCARVNSLRFSRLVFRSVHKKMGGNIQYMVSGGAALDREIALGLQTLGLQLLEGYGMTEAAPMIAFTRPGDLVPNCVGLPLSAMDVRIIDGEICAKGPNLMQGYYNRPEETAAVIDKDGYLHTGDLGRIDDEGRIYITGRSKEIIVLSNGKNVQPAEIEYKLEKYADRVKEAAVVQDGDLLRAIIVPVREWAQGLSDDEVEEVLKREVLEPYNLTVTNYKKLMSLFVYREDLPRTKLEKLQRYKLKDILAGKTLKTAAEAPVAEPAFEEYHIIKRYIEAEKKIQLRPTDHIETDLAFDSLDMVQLEGFIEQTFGTQVNAASMPTYRNIEALAAYVAESKTRMEVEDEDWHKFLHSNSSHLELPKTSCTMSLMAGLSLLFFKAYNRLSYKGLENLPSQGPFILAPNHESYLDGPLLTACLPGKVLHRSYFYADEKHVRGRVAQALARHHNVVLMERGNLRNSILKLAEVLKQGRNLVIFPEGTRTRTGQLGTFKKTFAILASEVEVPIIPVRIQGAYASMPRSSAFIRPSKITVEFLPPVQPRQDESYEDLAARVRDAIRG